MRRQIDGLICFNLSEAPAELEIRLKQTNLNLRIVGFTGYSPVDTAHGEIGEVRFKQLTHLQLKTPTREHYCLFAQAL